MRRVFVVKTFITPFLGKGNPDFVTKQHPQFGKRSNPTLRELIEAAVRGVVPDDAAIVDRIAVGNFTGELFCRQGHLGAAVGAIEGLKGKPAMRTEGACASGGLALQVIYDAIRAGSHVGLAVGAEVQTTVSAREGADFLARAADYERQRSIDDFTFPCLFAKRMKAIAGAGHFSMEDTARVVVKAYQNGKLNPLAHMRTKSYTLEEATAVSSTNPAFLSNTDYRDFMRLSDCSQVSDGAAGVLLASEEGLRRLGVRMDQCVEMAGLACAVGNLYAEPADPTRLETCASAAETALQIAGVTPERLEVAEVHDCFSAAELLMYEALGIAGYGKGKELICAGATARDGPIPVNTGGGLLSFGHPVGATGIKQVAEVVRQMLGACGEYQLPTPPKVGATLNMGGDDKTAVCTVLKRADL